MKKKTNTALLISFILWLVSLSISGQSYESLIEQGLAAAQEKNYDEAINSFRRALRLSPNDIRNALIYANIAHIQEAKGENLKAIGSYDMALGIAPENLPILQ